MAKAKQAEETEAPLSVKKGVNWHGIMSEILVALHVVQSILTALGFSTVVTSALDGQHVAGSKHYVGEALDFRTHHLSDDVKDTIVDQVQGALGSDYFVQLEHRGEPEEHLHVQYNRPGKA